MKKFSLYSLVPGSGGVRHIQVENHEKREALLKLAAEVLNITPDSLKITKREFLDKVAESSSQDEIFYISNLVGKRLLVLKIKEHITMRGPSNELVAMRYLENISFKEFHPVKLYGSTNLIINGHLYEVIAAEKIPGKTLKTYLAEISEQPETSKKRQQLLEELLEGVEASARAIAELHLTQPRAKLNPAYEQRKEFIFNTFFSSSHGKDLEGGSLHFRSLNDNSPIGLIHGNLHPGNIFYDSVTKQVTFNDLDASIESTSGGPIAYDLAQFSLLIEALGDSYDFTEEEQKALKRTFSQEYSRYGPVVSSESKAFYRGLLEMSYITGFDLEMDPFQVSAQTLEEEALSNYFIKDLHLKIFSVSQ